jgi:hypothetical protein
MSYTVKANELINWVDRAIDRQKAGSQRSKVILAMQTLILLAGILRSEHPLYPHEEHSYKIYWDARKLLKKRVKIFIPFGKFLQVRSINFFRSIL